MVGAAALLFMGVFLFCCRLCGADRDVGKCRCALDVFDLLKIDGDGPPSLYALAVKKRYGVGGTTSTLRGRGRGRDSPTREVPGVCPHCHCLLCRFLFPFSLFPAAVVKGILANGTNDLLVRALATKDAAMAYQTAPTVVTGTDSVRRVWRILCCCCCCCFVVAVAAAAVAAVAAAVAAAAAAVAVAVAAVVIIAVAVVIIAGVVVVVVHTNPGGYVSLLIHAVLTVAIRVRPVLIPSIRQFADSVSKVRPPYY